MFESLLYLHTVTLILIFTFLLFFTILHPNPFPLPAPSRLCTKLMKLVEDRNRMEQLAAGKGHPVSRMRNVEMEEMMEELQDKVRTLQTENEGLKKRLLVAKQQLINLQGRKLAPYSHVQSRVKSGLKKLRGDASPPSPTRPKSMSQIFLSKAANSVYSIDVTNKS